MDDYGVDLEEVRQVIAAGEVLVVRFQVVALRLLVDFRTDAEHGPLIQVVQPAWSIEERFRELKALRPSFPLPERIVSFLWLRGISALEPAGVLGWLRDRLVQGGGEDAARDLARAYARLRQDEHQILRAAIVGGEGFQSIWERSA